MTVTTATTATKLDRAEISRRNGRMSKGPSTPQGKQRSKFNAVKHGMTAKTHILPGEDSQAFQARLNAWTAEVQPRSEIEQALIERAVHAHWKLERADRAEAARLAHLITSVPAAEARREQEVAVALGFWLLSGRGQDAEPGLMENILNVLGTGPDSAKGPGHLDLLDHPQAIVFRLESTAAGCRWLLDRWAELRAELDRGRPWSHEQQVNAVRLLGKRPLDRSGCHKVVDPFQCCADITVPDDLDLEREDRWDRWLLRQLDERLPAPEAETIAAFRSVADRAIARLEPIAAEHRRRAEADDVAARLSFDPGAEGERLRRYEFSCDRSLCRSIDTLVKVRKSGVGVEAEAEAESCPDSEAPASPVATPANSTGAEPAPRETVASPTDDPADHASEPAGPPLDPASSQNEPTTPAVPLPTDRDEPTGPPPEIPRQRLPVLGGLVSVAMLLLLWGAARGGHHDPQNEPTAPSAHSDWQNEPSGSPGRVVPGTIPRPADRRKPDIPPPIPRILRDVRLQAASVLRSTRASGHPKGRRRVPIVVSEALLAAYTHDLGMAFTVEEHQAITDAQSQSTQRQHYLRFRDGFGEDVRQIDRLSQSNAPGDRDRAASHRDAHPRGVHSRHPHRRRHNEPDQSMARCHESTGCREQRIPVRLCGHRLSALAGADRRQPWAWRRLAALQTEPIGQERYRLLGPDW